MRTDFHHVYSKGEKVIFRDEEDYIHFQNRLAIEKYGKNLKILGFTIMSTHMHLVVESWDEVALQDFIANVKRAYSIHFKHKYHVSLPKEYFHISYSDDEDQYEQKKSRFVYVLKNPVHHQVCGSPFTYEFSSARYTFFDDLVGKKISKLYMDGLKKVSELGGRDLRRIIGRNPVDGNSTLVNVESGAISPLSIIDVSRARAYFGKYMRNYILSLHLNPKDSSGDHINEDALCIQTEKMNDIEVCKFIDNFTREHGLESFTLLKGELLNQLVEMLLGKFIPKAQINRCLWIGE